MRGLKIRFSAREIFIVDRDKVLRWAAYGSNGLFDKLAKDACTFAFSDEGDVVIGIAEEDRATSKMLGVGRDAVDILKLPRVPIPERVYL